MDTILENVASARLVTVGQFIEAFNAEREAITRSLNRRLTDTPSASSATRWQG